MSQPIRVAGDPLQAAANNLESLMEQARAVLNHYLQAAHDVHAPGVFLGQAAGANIVTTEEVQHAQMKLATKWGTLIDVLRNEGHKYVDMEQQNAQLLTGIASNV